MEDNVVCVCRAYGCLRTSVQLRLEQSHAILQQQRSICATVFVVVYTFFTVIFFCAHLHTGPSVSI